MWHLGGEEILVLGNNDLRNRLEFLFSSNRQTKTELFDTQEVPSGSRHVGKALRGVGVVPGGITG